MKKLNQIVGAVQALCAIIMIGAIKFWAPPCDGLLELKNGREIPMKCVHTGNATVAVAIILLVVALLTLFSKKDNKTLLIISGVTSVIIFLLFTSFIGICMKDTMQCHTTALWCKIAAGIAFVASVVGFLSGKEGQVQE